MIHADSFIIDRMCFAQQIRAKDNEGSKEFSAKRMRRRMIRNTILIVLPSIAISIVMVITQNA